MKTKVLVLLAVIAMTNLTLGQNRKVSLSVFYPFPVNEKNFSKAYSGTVGGEIDFTILQKATVAFDILLSYSYLTGDTSIHNSITPYKSVRSSFIQPGIQARLMTLPKFHPFAGLGYTVETSNFDLLSGRSESEYETSFTDGGINLNAGFQWNLAARVYFLLKYNYTRLSNDSDTGDKIRDIQSAGMVQAGLGVLL